MTDDDEHLAVEVAQLLKHVHDIADLLAQRMGSLPEAEAGRFSNRSLSAALSLQSSSKQRVAFRRSRRASDTKSPP